jgi:hypothetical protein
LCVENKINLSLVATVLLFFLGYLIARWIERLNKARARRVYLLAVLQEVALNLESIGKVLSLYPEAAKVYAFLRAGAPGAPTPRPFITFSYSSIVFTTNTEVLQDLNKTLVSNIIDFYGRLEGLATDIAALENKSYDTISLEGRDAIFADLQRDFALCSMVGRNVDSGVRIYLKL